MNNKEAFLNLLKSFGFNLKTNWTQNSLLQDKEFWLYESTNVCFVTLGNDSDQYCEFIFDKDGKFVSTTIAE